MEAILDYLKTKYQPLAVILYGSYADETNGPHSDLDALLLVEEGDKAHDGSVVDGVRLDVFILPLCAAQAGREEDFVQLLDGRVVLDTRGIGHELQQRVIRHWQQRPAKSREEVRQSVEWCCKMLDRSQRADAEGAFRWHWLLVDSLEIACDVLGQPYRGPKKSLRWLQENAPELFSAYHGALTGTDRTALACWVELLEQTLDVGAPGGGAGSSDSATEVPDRP